MSRRAAAAAGAAVPARPLLTPEETAVAIGVSLSTFVRMQQRREGPPAMRLGARIKRYRAEDVEAYKERLAAEGGATPKRRGRR
jgi:predicted DNA-binding transcriptional regulator AlpA